MGNKVIVNKLGVKENKLVAEANVQSVTFLDVENFIADDIIAVDEFEICIENDRESYQKIKSLFTNYAKKDIKGDFNDGLALKGIVNNIIKPYSKTYIKQFGTPGSTIKDLLTLNDRYLVAYRLLDNYDFIIDEYIEEYNKKQTKGI